MAPCWLIRTAPVMPPNRKLTSTRKNRTTLVREADLWSLDSSISDRPNSMPRSVTMPVTCVVRTTEVDAFVMSAFCSPIRKQKMAITNTSCGSMVKNNPVISESNAASTRSGRLN